MSQVPSGYYQPHPHAHHQAAQGQTPHQQIIPSGVVAVQRQPSYTDPRYPPPPQPQNIYQQLGQPQPSGSVAHPPYQQIQPVPTPVHGYPPTQPVYQQQQIYPYQSQQQYAPLHPPASQPPAHVRRISSGQPYPPSSYVHPTPQPTPIPQQHVYQQQQYVSPQPPQSQPHQQLAITHSYPTALPPASSLPAAQSFPTVQPTPAGRPLPPPPPKRTETLPPAASTPSADPAPALRRTLTSGAPRKPSAPPVNTSQSHSHAQSLSQFSPPSGSFPAVSPSTSSGLPSSSTFPSAESNTDGRSSPIRRPLPTPTPSPTKELPMKKSMTPFPSSTAASFRSNTPPSPTKRSSSPGKRPASPAKATQDEQAKRRASPPRFLLDTIVAETPGPSQGSPTKFVPLWKRALMEQQQQQGTGSIGSFPSSSPSPSSSLPPNTPPVPETTTKSSGIAAPESQGSSSRPLPSAPGNLADVKQSAQALSDRSKIAQQQTRHRRTPSHPAYASDAYESGDSDDDASIVSSVPEVNNTQRHQDKPSRQAHERGEQDIGYQPPPSPSVRSESDSGDGWQYIESPRYGIRDLPQREWERPREEESTTPAKRNAGQDPARGWNTGVKRIGEERNPTVSWNSDPQEVVTGQRSRDMGVKETGGERNRTASWNSSGQEAVAGQSMTLRLASASASGVRDAAGSEHKGMYSHGSTNASGRPFPGSSSPPKREAVPMHEREYSQPFSNMSGFEPIPNTMNAFGRPLPDSSSSPKRKAVPMHERKYSQPLSGGSEILSSGSSSPPKRAAATHERKYSQPLSGGYALPSGSGSPPKVNMKTRPASAFGFPQGGSSSSNAGGNARSNSAFSAAPMTTRSRSNAFDVRAHDLDLDDSPPGSVRGTTPEPTGRYDSNPSSPYKERADPFSRGAASPAANNRTPKTIPQWKPSIVDAGPSYQPSPNRFRPQYEPQAPPPQPSHSPQEARGRSREPPQLPPRSPRMNSRPQSMGPSVGVGRSPSQHRKPAPQVQPEDIYAKYPNHNHHQRQYQQVPQPEQKRAGNHVRQATTPSPPPQHPAQRRRSPFRTSAYAHARARSRSGSSSYDEEEPQGPPPLHPMHRRYYEREGVQTPPQPNTHYDQKQQQQQYYQQQSQYSQQQQNQNTPRARDHHGRHQSVPAISVSSADRVPTIPQITFNGLDSDEHGDSGDEMHARRGPQIVVDNADARRGGGPQIFVESDDGRRQGGVIAIESPAPVGGRDTRPDIPRIEFEVPGIAVEYHGGSRPPAFSASAASGPHYGAVPGARGRGGLMCGGCGGAIIGRIVSAMGARWHPGCFRCTVCDGLLEHVSSYEHAGRPYCHLDYHENFAPRCYTCKTAIIEERFISLDDPALGKRTYHAQHFFCAECGDPFLTPSSSTPSGGELSLSGDGEFEADDVGFTVYRGHPYCEACHVRLRLPKCKRCKRSIRDGDQAVEALGGKWCWSCFVCARCEKPFDDPAFFERGEKPYCEPCFSIILRNEI